MDRLSSIRQRTLLGGASQHPWLVVFPLQIQFTSSVDYSTVLYFEKNYQVIGDLKTTIPPTERKGNYFFTSLDCLLSFKMFSAQNLTYKWSLYRKYDSGQQEFIESVPVDFKVYLADQVTAVRSSLMGTTIDSLNLPAAIEKQLIGTFTSNGMKLKYLFLAIEDIKSAEEIALMRIAALKERKADEQVKGCSQIPATVQNPGSSQANIDISSKVDTEQPLKDIPSNPQMPNSTPQATPQDQKEEEQKQTPAPAPTPAPLIQSSKPQQSPIDESSTPPPLDVSAGLSKSFNIEKAISIVDIDLLKLESEQERKVPEGERKEEGQNLQIISQETQKHSTQGNPYPPQNSSADHAEEVAPEPVKDAKSKMADMTDTLNTALSIQIDLKKVIILLLVVTIGMMVMLWPKQKKQKAPKNKSKKVKSK